MQENMNDNYKCIMNIFDITRLIIFGSKLKALDFNHNEQIKYMNP